MILVMYILSYYVNLNNKIDHEIFPPILSVELYGKTYFDITFFCKIVLNLSIKIKYNDSNSSLAPFLIYPKDNVIL